MTDKDTGDGGSASPIVGSHDDVHSAGLSIRDHFAGLALVALISHPNKDGDKRGKHGVPVLAGFAYEYADAMLRARLAR